MVTVSASGVKQHATPWGEICSQLPPVAVAATALKRILLAPVLVIGRIWGKGFAPPNGLVKLRGFTWLKTLSPTATLIGMVTLLPAAEKTSCPVKVPAISPPFGSR